MTATLAAQDLRLTVNTRGGWHRFDAVFTGPDADAIAARYVGAHSGRSYSVTEDFDEELFPLTAAALFPTCPHGLSEALCAGPGHYPAGL